MAFDYIRIALFDECGESPERVSLGFLYVVRIDNDQFFPAAVVRQRDAYQMIVIAGVIPTPRGYRKHFELHAFQLLERQILEQRASSCGEIMLNRIWKPQEIAIGALASASPS